MAKIKDAGRIRSEEFKQTKGFLRSHFRDPSMETEDWRLVEKGVKSFQKISDKRDEDDLVQVVKSIKDTFNNTKTNKDRIPVRLVYALIIAMIIIPNGEGGKKEYDWLVKEIINAILTERKIHHYDDAAIIKVAKEYKELMTEENTQPKVALYSIMVTHRAS